MVFAPVAFEFATMKKLAEHNQRIRQLLQMCNTLEKERCRRSRARRRGPCRNRNLNSLGRLSASGTEVFRKTVPKF
jgi:hypothetical protein